MIVSGGTGENACTSTPVSQGSGMIGLQAEPVSAKYLLSRSFEASQRI
jgi:hypothetical protein